MEANIGKHYFTKKDRRPLVMGILNLTPDSFYDGGSHNNIKDILTKKNEIVEFLNRCEKNQRIFEIQENELINKLMRIKKRYANKEEYFNSRDEWNSR